MAKKNKNPAKKSAAKEKPAAAAAKKKRPVAKKAASVKKKPAAKKPVPTNKKLAPAQKKPAPAKKRSGQASVRDAAIELIGLERELASENVANDLGERWMTLVNRVLGSSVGPHPRRSVRLPAQLPVRLGIRKGEFVCQLTDVSHLGVTVEGAVLAHIGMDEPVEIRALESNGASRPIGVRSTVVRIDGTRAPAVAGLSLSEDNDDGARRRYFDEIYYPLYLAYLDERARGR